MAYSCGYWTGDGADYGSADAQRDKLELICRKLGLEPGARLLDIGCGWGSLTLYAAERHGVHVTAVTLAAEQAAYVRQQVAERGLDDLVEVLNIDYRDVPGRPGTRGAYDAVSTVEMGEHVGDAEYPAFTAILHDALRPRGRALVQQMSRGANAPGGGAFIESYIAPDMHMRPVGETVSLLEGAGFEVRDVESLREHYVLTVEAWRRTLEERWAEFTALVGGGDRAGVAALPRRRRARLRGAADGRRPDPLRPAGRGRFRRDARHPARLVRPGPAGEER